MESTISAQASGSKRPRRSSTSEAEIVVEKSPLPSLPAQPLPQTTPWLPSPIGPFGMPQGAPFGFLLPPGAPFDKLPPPGAPRNEDDSDSDDEEDEYSGMSIETLQSLIQNSSDKLNDQLQTLERRRDERLKENADEEGSEKLDEILEQLEKEMKVAEEQNEELERQILENTERDRILYEELKQLTNSQATLLTEINHTVFGPNTFLMMPLQSTEKQCQTSDSQEFQQSCEQIPRKIKKGNKSERQATKKLKSELKEIERKLKEAKFQNNIIFLKKEEIDWKTNDLNELKEDIEENKMSLEDESSSNELKRRIVIEKAALSHLDEFLKLKKTINDDIAPTGSG